VVRTEEAASASLLHLVALMRRAAVVVVSHGTQVYNVVFARVSTVVLELAVDTTEHKSANGENVLMSNCPVSTAVGMRTWVLPVEGVGWHKSMSVRPFIVHVPRLLSIILHESHVAAAALASVRVQWKAPAGAVSGGQRRRIVGGVHWRHLDLVQEEWCDVACPECALAEGAPARARHECLFVAVQAAALGEPEAGAVRTGKEAAGMATAFTTLAVAPLQVGGQCFGQGECLCAFVCAFVCCVCLQRGGGIPLCPPLARFPPPSHACGKALLTRCPPLLFSGALDLIAADTSGLLPGKYLISLAVYAACCDVSSGSISCSSRGEQAAEEGRGAARGWHGGREDGERVGLDTSPQLLVITDQSVTGRDQVHFDAC